MLPAWATVALALGAAFIGALAGVVGSYFGLRGTTLDLSYREREAWRTRLIEAVQAESDAWHALTFPLTRGAFGVAAFDAASQTTFDNAVAAYAQALSRVELLFGSESAVGQAADQLGEAVGPLVSEVVVAESPWAPETADRIRDLLIAADGDVRDDYLRAASTAIRPSRWDS